MEKSKLKPVVLAIAALVVVFLLLAGVKAAQIKSMIQAGKSFVPPAEAVTSAKVMMDEWPRSTAGVGSITAVQSVVIAAELPGTVRSIGFASGEVAKRGQVLVKLDTSVEEANLRSAEAELSLAKSSLDRARGLREGGANTVADLDAASARAAQAEAAVASLQATIAKKTLRAPFDGRLGIKSVEVGQVVSPGLGLVSLQSFDAVHAEFWMPQQALVDLRVGLAVRIVTDTFPNESWSGQIKTISPEIDPKTRNVRVQAVLENGDGRLLPGMFVNVEVLGSKPDPVLTIPASAVLYAPYGDSVFAIEEKRVDDRSERFAKQKFVRLGERRGDLVRVMSGLDAGETIVSSGAFKLRNGARLEINDELRLDAELEPTLRDR